MIPFHSHYTHICWYWHLFYRRHLPIPHLYISLSPLCTQILPTYHLSPFLLPVALIEWKAYLTWFEQDVLGKCIYLKSPYSPSLSVIVYLFLHTCTAFLGLGSLHAAAVFAWKFLWPLLSVFLVCQLTSSCFFEKRRLSHSHLWPIHPSSSNLSSGLIVQPPHSLSVSLVWGRAVICVLSPK